MTKRRPRFSIRRHPLGDLTRSPWVLRDRVYPFYVGQFPTHTAALAVMDERAKRLEVTA